MSSESAPTESAPAAPRTLVLVFDGTSNEYNKYDTNAVKLFGLLKKDDWRTQLCYYQSGIGTYFTPSLISPVWEWCAKILDEAIAFYLHQHVMDGYRFLMENYHEGDKICLFGFSRGAYTARALSGMLHKVGLLPRSNQEQIPFAYKMYQNTSADGIPLAAGYKKTFCQDVKIDYLGCWDTVASVGIVMGRTLPFTATNSSIKTFRHALALDERRVRFQPLLVEPKIGDADIEAAAGPDVLETWFIGCHGDIGGGDEAQDVQRSLADISLRWMVRHVQAAQCGIRFDVDAIARSQIAFEFPPELGPDDSPVPPSLDSGYTSAAEGKKTTTRTGRGLNLPDTKQNMPTTTTQADRTIDYIDSSQLMHDSLQFTGPGAGGGGGVSKVGAFLTALGWTVLEAIPMVWRVQDTSGKWHVKFGIHWKKGRQIIDPKPNFHITVRERMQSGTGYAPRAKWVSGTEVYVE